MDIVGYVGALVEEDLEEYVEDVRREKPWVDEKYSAADPVEKTVYDDVTGYRDVAVILYGPNLTDNLICEIQLNTVSDSIYWPS